MAKKAKETYVMSEYTANIHKTGRLWFIGVYIFIILFPVITCIYFDAWPTWKQFLGAAVAVVPTYWVVGVVENFTYTPMLGAGGSYLAFITGNMANLKVPAAINAQDSLGVKQGTEEGDVISTIAIAVSSIITVLIIVVFVVLMVPLTPVFANPVLQPAFNNIVPALFGGLMVAFLVKDLKVGVPIVAFGIALFTLVPSLAGIFPLLTPVFAALAILLARVLYKKGKI